MPLKAILMIPPSGIPIHADSKLCNQNSLLHSTASVFDQISQEHADIMMLISMMVRRIQDTKD